MALFGEQGDSGKEDKGTTKLGHPLGVIAL